MKIGFTSPYSPRGVTGIGTFLQELSRALREKSHSTWIVAPILTHETSRDYKGEGLTIAEVPLNRWVHFRDFFLAVGTAQRLLRARRDVDVIHAQQAHVQTVSAVLTARVLGRKVVSTLHLRVPRPKGWARSSLLKFVEWFTLRFADEIVYVSRQTGADFGATRGTAIPNGVDTSMFRPDPVARKRRRLELGVQDACVVLFLSRWARIKGIEETLESMSRVVAARGNAVRFVIVGGGLPEERISVNEQLRLRGVESVVLTEWEAPDTRPWYHAADVFILPSHAEGMPLALLEAMSMGLACIVTPVGGIPEVVEDGVDALVVRPGDGEALAQAILRCADDSELRRAIGRRAREKARALFDLDRMADDYIKLYSRLPRP